MKLVRLAIKNFRGITDLTLNLATTTVLVGENNSGKTSVLEALSICLSKGLTRRAVPFSEYDFHLADANATPTAAPPITITLTFEEAAEDEWPPDIDQAFDRAVQVLADNRKQLSFQVNARYDTAVRDYVVEWAFLDQTGLPLPTARQPKMVTDLQSIAPVFLLAAVRDASQHFHARSSFWGPFTKNPQLADADRRVIETQIEELNQAILASHQPFNVVKAAIAKTGGLLPLAAVDTVSVEAVPARIFDMLAKTQVKLACQNGAKLPIAHHGAGTQSLSVLFLFEAFLQSQLARAYDAQAEPILAMEEPESHLHPSAIRALWSTLDGLAGQKLIATHSGDLLATVPLDAVRRLARKDGVVQVFQLQPNTLNDREQQKVKYHIRAKRGMLLFSRCWLLVEGETEFTVLPELARLLNLDFEVAGVCCVEFAQCGLVPLIKVARDLGIEWHLLADGDPAGQAYARTVNGLLGGDPPADRITALPELDMEHCLWQAGYNSVYESKLTTRELGTIGAAPGTPQYMANVIKAAIKATSKPHLAYEAITAVTTRGATGVPGILDAAIRKAVQLAGRTR